MLLLRIPPFLSEFDPEFQVEPCRSRSITNKWVTDDHKSSRFEDETSDLSDDTDFTFPNDSGGRASSMLSWFVLLID